MANPTDDFMTWCRNNLYVDNPDYWKKQRMGKYTGRTPKEIKLYEVNDNIVCLPFGCLYSVYYHFKDEMDFTMDIAPFYRQDYKSHINLYPYQEEAVKKALNAKNGVVVMPCGAGKTQTALEIIARVGGKALWLTHTYDLLHQSMNRAKSVLDAPLSSYGMISNGRVNIGSGITFATVQTMAKIDLTAYKSAWDIVVVDECMPADTKITTPYGVKDLSSLQIGDIVTSYNRKLGKVENKRVIHTFKSKAHDIVNVNLSNGEKIICTGNHPIFTKRGWIDAERLEQNDYVMRMVRERGRNRQYAKYKQAQSIAERMVLLFKRMFCKGWSQEGCMDGRTQKKSIRTHEEDKRRVSFTDNGKNDKKQSYEKSRHEGEGVKATKGNRASSKNKMWKWCRTYCTTTKLDACTCRKNRGICRVPYTNKNGQGKWLSNLLQGRHSNSSGNDRNRSRWFFTLCDKQTRAGQEERNSFEWIRVESVEVQKQTGDGTFGGVCGDGYVYNIEVEDNNNYFANGYLVHNCHKAVGSPTKMMQFYKVLSALSCRYKFGVTATPKRADGLEKTMFALLGGIIHEVPKEAVAGNTCPVKVQFVPTGYIPDPDNITMGDGTLDYASLITDLTHDPQRFEVVSEYIQGLGGSVLVLGNRVEYLQALCDDYMGNSMCLSGMGNSKTAKRMRAKALEDLNNGKIDCLFATYQLAKEGLDCPNLRYVVFATPEKDPTTVTQSAGRVGRKAENKPFGTVVDFVDDFGMYRGWQKKRIAVYKKLDFEII